jgi:hypothetical protein
VKVRLVPGFKVYFFRWVNLCRYDAGGGKGRAMMLHVDDAERSMVGLHALNPVVDP